MTSGLSPRCRDNRNTLCAESSNDRLLEGVRWKYVTGTSVRRDLNTKFLSYDSYGSGGSGKA